MGRNTFTVNLEGEVKSVSITIAKPEFIEGWWTSDKEGKTLLQKSKLGETVYFHVEVKGIAVGQELELNLAEFDYNGSGGFIFSDIIDPDDRKFPDDAVLKKTSIEQKGNKRIATVALFLNEKWQGIIKDDHDVWFSLDEAIELYWEVVYGSLKKSLPNKKEDYLKVRQSDRTLYFKPPALGHNLPELLSKDGSPLLLMKFIMGKVKGKITSKAIDFAKKKMELKISDIALTKLQRGSLVTNTGRVQTNINAEIFKTDTYTNDGVFMEELKKRKNWGNATETTKGISQYDYFTQSGKRVRVLGFLKNFDTGLDFFDLLKFGMEDELDTNSPLGSLGMGGLGTLGSTFALVNSVAGLLVKQMKQEDDIFMEEVVQQELQVAKTKGIEGIRKFVSDWGHNEEYAFRLEKFSTGVTNEILKGTYITLREARQASHNQTKNDTKFINILYRISYSQSKEKYIEVLETIFYDEYLS
ncbi:hypothetical protein [Ulvibacter litoralis]|uniref:Uncharacterized protein n=1 Tax=Ulvibacter litoralis TaxID=227084 RepID=A0A1G7J1H9_9FLAO|nr:hypothetical protein [Ulvibacter litoralis]GHC60476.1 hypothetical protein GCM10008083_26760 [Ulvibacter litoralis]SDF18664.1 hypothetical protein SAMN05421855_10835 [Ulvibacter litoralis]